MLSGFWKFLVHKAKVLKFSSRTINPAVCSLTLPSPCTKLLSCTECQSWLSVTHATDRQTAQQRKLIHMLFVLKARKTVTHAHIQKKTQKEQTWILFFFFFLVVLGS